MKKILFLFMILALFNTVFCRAQLNIDNLSVTDSMIDVGESGLLSFSVTNDGDNRAINAEVSLSSSLNLSANSIRIGTLEDGETKKVIINYYAPENIMPGDYAIFVNIDYDDSKNYFVQDSVSIKINSYNHLITEDYTSGLVINENNDFSLNISNQGDEDLKNILLDIIMPSGFVPRRGSQFFIKKLGVGESRVFNITVFVEKSIEPGNFQFVLNKTANAYYDKDVLNLAVRGSPELAFSGINLDPELPVADSEQMISVQIENIGTDKAYSINVQLNIPNENITGVKSEYLGTLERDDLTTGIFDLNLPRDLNSIDGEIIVNYENELGTEHAITQNFSYYVKPVQTDNTMMYYIIGGVALMVLWLLWNRFRK